MEIIKTFGLTHISIAVRDLDRTIRFYRQVFGMEVMYLREGFAQLTTPESHDILVFEEREKDLAGSSGGIAHFGFRLKSPVNAGQMAAIITEAGGNVIDHGEFAEGSPYIFFRDPEGYEVEVWYELV